ncbi:ScbA/BarX family gamma-butyrolactone biosynthesis protein [Streptomyces sp. CAU 1734]|uniref:ScbA/BarX family gamma-butyrolactone biosynthesis protein n=1 Tax=Streptomyces sp. CAU 1734 TaxID=3140360 RepID=UPI003261AAA8
MAFADRSFDFRPPGGAMAPLSPRQCHRARAQDAFATGWTALGPNRFLVRAAWPREHPFFTPLGGRVHDPLLIVETMRQSAMAVLHAAFGVPLGHHFLLTGIDYACHPRHLAPGNGPGPGAADADDADGAEVELVFPELKYRGGHLSQLLVQWTVRRGGAVAATGTGLCRITAPQVYRRLRGPHTAPVSHHPAAPPVRAALAGRTRPADVLLTPAGRAGTWELLADTRHPTLFQRPGDHIPGMLLLEAARQAACAAAGPDPFLPQRGAVSFHRYAEFDTPCVLQAAAMPAPGGARVVRVTGHQGGAPVFLCTLAGPGPGAAATRTRRPAAVPAAR